MEELPRRCVVINNDTSRCRYNSKLIVLDVPINFLLLRKIEKNFFTGKISIDKAISIVFDFLKPFVTKVEAETWRF